MDTAATTTVPQKPAQIAMRGRSCERLRSRLGDLLPDVKKKKMKKKKDGRRLGLRSVYWRSAWGGWCGYGRQGLCRII